jgi:hypothetical protein
VTIRQRHALRAPGLALALVVAGPTPAGAQHPATAPEILIEVRIERGPSRVVFARIVGERVHLAGREMLELAGVEILRVAPDTLLEFRTTGAATPTVIVTRAGYLDRGGARTSLPGWSATWIDGALYLEASLLDWLLGVSTSVDLAGLSVVLTNADHLPAVALMARQQVDARRAALLATPELLVDVRLERGPSGLALARSLDGTTWIAAHQLLELAEIKVTWLAADTGLAFVLEPEGTAVEIHTGRGYAARGAERRDLPPLGALWIEGIPYVELELFVELLGVGATANLAELAITVRNAVHLPAVARVLREQRRARLRPEGALADLAYAPIHRRAPVVGGAVLDWAAQLGTTAPSGPGKLSVESGAIQVGLGVGLLGGSGLLVHEERWLPGVVGNVRGTDASWTRVWPTSERVRQVRLGEVSGTGRQPRRIQGAVITNAPFVRPVTFAGGILRGTLPVGWEVELYRQGALVGLATVGADGRYAFDVPLVYGTNPVEVLGYGPTGEIRRFERTFEVPFERLPVRQFEYGIGGGGCGTDPCQATGNIDLRYGATRQLTVRAGWDQFWRDTLPDLWHPYGSATFQATRSLAVFGEVVGNAQAGGLLSFAPSPDLRASVGHTHFVGDSIVAPLIGTALLDDITTASVFLRPGALSRRWYVQADARRASGAFQRRYDARVTLTARIPSVRLDAGIRVGHASLRPAPFVTATVLSVQALYQTGVAFGPLRRSVLRVGIEVAPDSGLDRAVFGFARTLLRDYSLDATVAWDRDVGVIANLGVKANLPSVRFASQNRIDDFGAVGLQSAEGSLMYDEDGRRLAIGNGRGLGRAGVTGVAFLDLDGDGVRDPGEPPVVGALVRVGPWVAEADVNGRYTVWDVVPFETLLIEVDPGSAADPLWVPSALRYVLHPDPNQFVPVDIPFVQTVEAMGEVRLAPEGTPVAGIHVMLEPQDGSEPYIARTFSDGAFYLMGIRPGVYRVTITPTARAAFGLKSDDLLIEVVRGQTTVAEGIVLRVRRGEN